jgi:hypothetical protein
MHGYPCRIGGSNEQDTTLLSTVLSLVSLTSYIDRNITASTIIVLLICYYCTANTLIEHEREKHVQAFVSSSFQ